ncbi:MAG: hypothetical protein AB1918_05115 [Pseudomonadota bacterium]
MKNDKALVTVVIGQPCVDEWNRFFRPTWEEYARRHGYDIIAIPHYIDKSPRGTSRSPHWQKLRILEREDVRGYKNVVWLDSDILINYHLAPCIVTHHASERVGLVSERQTVHESPVAGEIFLARHERFAGRFPSCREKYQMAALPPDVDDYSNTGVIVLRPDLHRGTLAEVYAGYEENAGSAKEESPLSYHLYKNDLVKPLDSRFNLIWYREMVTNYPVCLSSGLRMSDAGRTIISLCVNMAWHNSWFMHFTGDRVDDLNGSYRTRDDVGYVFTSVDDILKLHLR